MLNKEIFDFIEEHDVKFIRLGFCTPFGVQKNISILADELKAAFEDGISFDASAIEGFADISRSDLLLFPDVNTLALLPWRPNVNSVLRFYCDVKNPDKTSFESDSRHILKNAVDRLKGLGLSCKIGTECEFYLFKTAEDGTPLQQPLDNGGYLDISPLDKGENVRRDICLCLEEMGLKPERSHHEQGPGQNEIDFMFSDVLSSADNFLTFKSVVKTIADRNGLFASFMPKPLLNKSGSGMHINISLYKDGENIFASTNKKTYAYAESFIAGVMDKIGEISLFLNQTNNSYARLGNFEAPKYISWSHHNRSQLIRIPAAASADKKRMELRSADCALNPYIAFALILHAGIHGIENRLALPAPVDENLYTAGSDVTNNLAALPQNLGEAIQLAKNSNFVKEHLGEELLARFVELKQQESADFEGAADKQHYYETTYFEKL